MSMFPVTQTYMGIHVYAMTRNRYNKNQNPGHLTKVLPSNPKLLAWLIIMMHERVVSVIFEFGVK